MRKSNGAGVPKNTRLPAAHRAQIGFSFVNAYGDTMGTDGKRIVGTAQSHWRTNALRERKRSRLSKWPGPA